MADSKLQFILFICCLNSVLSELGSQRKNWTYTREAFTFNGEECVSDCENSQCVVNLEGEMRACYTTDMLPFVFYTSRSADPNSTECMSNCKKFEHGFQWCVTKNGIIDYCNSSPVSPPERSSRNLTCIRPCVYSVALKMYKCYTGIFYDFCAPPASAKHQPDDSKTSATEKPQNSQQIEDKPVISEEKNQNQCNCDCGCKNYAEYNKNDIYFKIEVNLPHEIVKKMQGNQYHFTINFDSKISEKEKGSSDSLTEKPEGNEHTDQTTDAQDQKPNKTVSEHSSTNNQDNEQSDEIASDMWRSHIGKE